MGDDKGKIQRIVSTGHNITLARAFQLLRAQELATRVDKTGGVINITDAEARSKYVNPDCEQITSDTRAEFLEKTAEVLLPGKKYDAAFYEAICTNTISSSQVRNSYLNGKRQDKSLSHQLPTISCAGNVEGAIAHYEPDKRTDERLEKINECFLSFGSNSNENINRLTTLCGELLEATIALYNRLEGGLLYSLGRWQTPDDYNPVAKPDGHICYDTLKHGKLLVVANLPQTKYAQSDPNVSRYQLQTYFGHPVKCGGTIVGVVCAVYQQDFLPSKEDKKLISIIASAIGVEEERKQALEALRESEAKNRALLKAIPDLMFRVSKDGTYLDFMAAKEQEQDLVVPVSELLGKRICEVMPTEVAVPAMHYTQQAISTGRTQLFEYQLPINGSLRDFEARIVKSGKDEVLAIVRDITEGKQREASLLERSRLMTLEADVGIALSRSQTLRDILQRCAEAMVRHLDAAFARIWTLNTQENVLELQASAGMYTHIDGPHRRVPVGQFKIGLIAQSRQPHLTNKVIGDPRIHDQEWAKREGMVAFAGYPLIVEDRVVGVMAMFARQPLTETTLQAMVSITSGLALVIQRQQAQEALRESEERYALAACAANDGLWDWNLKTNAMYFSPRWQSRIGCKYCQISNSPDEWFNRVHPEDIERLKIEIAAHLEGYTTHLESEYRMWHEDGTYHWMLSRGLSVRDADGKPIRMAGSQTDITQPKLAREELLHEVFHDVLTGLPNRALFMQRLSHALKQANRREDYLFAVLFLDLDRFKVVNDSLGHMIGDRLLMAFARRLEACLRSVDTVARFGGDEFAILIEDLKDVSSATQVAERIHKELMSPFKLSRQEVFTSASIGIALSTTGYDNSDDLLRDADIAMYRAKTLGKARYAVFDTAMHERAVRLLELENDLRRAIERQEFQLHYQPIVSLKSGKITGFEALVRWQHPKRGLVFPGEFIPVAEETGVIIPIDQWVLREACRQMRTWERQFPENSSLTISVNLSAKQFSSPDLLPQINQILRETSLDASRLRLEITESAIMENAESAATMLLQLRNLGIQLYLDDFGTGYSSLSYLQRFPVDMLKIDRSFVSKIGINGENSEIIRTIVTLAHMLGMSVIAEGVETAQQMTQIRAMNCEYGQGYLFSKPVDSKTAGELIVAARQWW